jgi:hypothetical protein
MGLKWPGSDVGHLHLGPSFRMSGGVSSLAYVLLWELLNV